MKLAKDSATSNPTSEGYCGFDCTICYHGPETEQQGCSCQVSFAENKRQQIATAIARNKLKDQQKVKQEESSLPSANTAASAFMLFALDR